jgi:YfiR/HmsC-like
MKTIVYSLMSLLLIFAVVVCAGDEQIQNRESQIKAAFLYNFIQFTEWPADKLAEPNTITIGLLGEHPFGNAFDPIKNKTVKDKQLIIKNLGVFRKSFQQNDAGKLEFANYIQQLRKCHVLFICDSEHENYKTILDAVKGYGVLTVGETEDFLGFGGIITFIPGTQKPVFEVNIDSCENERLKISSKVLRLARKVIDYDAPGTVNKNK